MPTGTPVTIAEAKGRPMLHWVGKRPLDHVTAFPAQLIETFNPSLPSPLGEPVLSAAKEGAGGEGLLFHGDNKDVLAWLLAHGYRGIVDLIYIDPPFDSGADYVRRVELRGTGTAKIQGEAYTLGEQVQYTDIWINDTYLQFMYERLLLLKELLSEGGVIVLHCDYRKTHHLRLLLDEVFGTESLQNEIIWQKTRVSKAQSTTFGNIHDTLWVFSTGKIKTFRPQYEEYATEYVSSHYNLVDENGRKYGLWDFTQAGSGLPRRFGDKEVAPPSGKHWIWGQERIDEAMSQNRIEFTSSGMPRLRRYLDEAKGKQIGDLWTDVFDVNSQALERLDYPTQKPEALLERIIQASSNPGDLVLDCFCGSGTTPAVAQKLGRRWIAADINKGAIQTTSKRLQTIIREQLAAAATPKQPSLVTLSEAEGPQPASLAFSVYRVNDYDLQIQHNEAVALAVEHIGIERLKTDTFFEGTLGKRLVKIIPFNHPLTLLDLQMLQDELAARPREDRDITIVCLGKETAVDAWLVDYNRHRPVNKIDLVELRTDQKYGKFLVHQPAQADVTVKRENGKIVVEIEDFISPTIVERLEMDTPLFKATITDWRAMVDCVMIDTAYNGAPDGSGGPEGSGVFNIVLSDVPERKNDLVAGRYTLPAPAEETVVAVKIIDMLGEEILKVFTV